MRLEIEENDEYGVPLTPLIDIVFLLLIFFATSTSFIDPEKDLKVDLPSGDQGVTEQEESRDIIINVRRTGIITVRSKILDIDALRKLLKEATADNENQAVIIRGDSKTYHKNVVDVLNACVDANVRNLSIAQEASQPR